MNTACLAPNGMSVYHGAAAPNRLVVGTAKGISSLLIEPLNGGLYAGDLAPVSKVGHYRLLLPGAVSSRQRAAHAQP